MNAPNQWYQESEESNEVDYQVHMRRDTNSPEMKSNRREKPRTKNRPVSMNGMHRRKNKHWSW